MKRARAIREEVEQQFSAGAGLLADLRLELRSSREREKELLLQLQRAQERLRQFEELEKEAIDREEEACCGICGEDCLEEEEEDVPEESDIVEHVAALAALLQCPASVDGFCSLLGEYGATPLAHLPLRPARAPRRRGRRTARSTLAMGTLALGRIWHALRPAGATTRGAGLCTTAVGRSAGPDAGARSVASWRILFLAALDQGHLVHGGRRVSGPL